MHTNNILYKDIHIDHLLIDTLPSNDIPDCLWDTMSILNESETSDIERSGYVDNNINLNELCLNGVVPLNMSALLDTSAASISSNDIRHHLKLRTNVTDEITNLNDNIYAVPHEQYPVNEYFNTSFLPGIQIDSLFIYFYIHIIFILKDCIRHYFHSE